MAGIIENLRMFNRKERFYLVGMALGNPEFKLCEEFRKKIGEALDLDVPEKGVFTAMDYHLDWIYASLFLFFNPNANGVYSNDDKRITASQEDVDFLVAYEDKEACRIIVLEAKGEMGFANRQLNHKAQRLKGIFVEFEAKEMNGNRVVPYFAIVSRKKPQRLDYKNWPHWMEPDNIRWIKMDMPRERKKITRCDENGKPSETGKYWKVDSTGEGRWKENTRWKGSR